MPRALFVLDAIDALTPAMAQAVVVCGAPGDVATARHILTLPAPPYAVILHDAGIGKDDAGILGLLLLEQAHIIGATCAHQSARIGDGADMLDHGTLSRVNGAALAAGLRGGMAVVQAVRALGHEPPAPQPAGSPRILFP